jgi:hypothetical protein
VVESRDSRHARPAIDRPIPGRIVTLRAATPQPG